MGLTDRMVWCLTKDGQYLVNSGYKLAEEWGKCVRGNKGTSTGRDKEEEVLWRRIWTLNIKKKVQHFLWRACHNKISVGANLRKKGIKVYGVCHQYGELMEIVEHMLFHCQNAHILWKLAPVQWDGLTLFTYSLKE